MLVPWGDAIYNDVVHVPAGPGGCIKVGCQDNNAVFVCNDVSHAFTSQSLGLEAYLVVRKLNLETSLTVLLRDMDTISSIIAMGLRAK